ncbi:SDR family NAD(P)-dependent oxidoreductase [Sorangium sp. So ce362]|uniref:SDR family NAD(P)-dependent oxidoreductase n=1 Tax=Sorangium sp. So ce362 TaxID=3133303 RepID=UPI003F64561B
MSAVRSASANERGARSSARSSVCGSAARARAGSRELDLASLRSVRRFAQELAAEGAPVRALLCNAGVQLVSEASATDDGVETTFAVNHLGHFLLVNLLLPCFTPGGRIVIVSSDTHDPAKATGIPAPWLVDPLPGHDDRHGATPAPEPREPETRPGPGSRHRTIVEHLRFHGHGAPQAGEGDGAVRQWRLTASTDHRRTQHCC